MGFPAYLSEDLLAGIDFDTDVSSSSEDSDYPLENLADRNPANVFKFESATNGYIEFDFGSTQSINTIALLNHSFDSGDNITVKAGASPDPSTVIATFIYRARDMVAFLSTAESARYLRLVWSGATAAHSIGEMVVGESVTLSSQFSQRIGSQTVEKKIRRETPRGVKSSFDLYCLEQREYLFRELSTTEKNAFRTMHESLGGDRYPMLWLPNVSTSEVLYGYKQENFEARSVNHHRWEYILSITSASRGE